MRRLGRSDSSGPSRRDVVVLGVGAFAVAALPWWRRAPARLTRRTIPVMGTLGEIGVVHRDTEYAQAAIDAAFTQLRYVDRVMSRFSGTSDVGRANLHASRDGVRVTEATAAVLREGLAWAEASEGAFDPCLGKAIELWDVGQRRTPPSETAFARLAGRRLYRTLDLGQWRGGSSVRFTEPDTQIDLGGIAKGYGVDRAVQELRDWGIRDALVNVGGDLYAMGRSEDGDPWSVGVRAPWDPSQLMQRLELGDAALATSGDYLQFFRYQGERYHHLLDPETAAPRHSSAHSVTVRAHTCMTADAAATTVFGMSHQEAAGVLRVQAPEAEVVSAA